MKTAIDPAGCHCTECLTGEYVPLDWATADDVTDMLAGRLANHTGHEVTFAVIAKFGGHSFDVSDTVRVKPGGAA